MILILHNATFHETKYRVVKDFKGPRYYYYCIVALLNYIMLLSCTILLCNEIQTILINLLNIALFLVIADIRLEFFQ